MYGCVGGCVEGSGCYAQTFEGHPNSGQHNPCKGGCPTLLGPTMTSDRRSQHVCGTHAHLIVVQAVLVRSQECGVAPTAPERGRARHWYRVCLTLHASWGKGLCCRAAAASAVEQSCYMLRADHPTRLAAPVCAARATCCVLAALSGLGLGLRKSVMSRPCSYPREAASLRVDRVSQGSPFSRYRIELAWGGSPWQASCLHSRSVK